MAFSAPATVHQATLAGLNPLDWALAAMLVFSAVTAFLRGLIRSLVSLAGVALGIVLAAWYASAAGVWLGRWIPQPLAAEVVAFAGILAATYLSAIMLGRVLVSASRAVGLGLVDRVAGAVFGVVRTVLILAAALVPLSPFLGLIPFTADSVLLPYLRTAAHGVSFVVPQDFENRLATGVRQVQPAAPAARAHRSQQDGGRAARQSTIEGEKP